MVTNCKVLLVEDIESEAKLVFKHLKRVSDWRFSVDHFERLDTAIQSATDNKYDVILLDLNLPDCAGIEVCKRTLKAVANTPVIVLTNQNSPALGTKAMREGAQDYLIKKEVDGPLLGRSIRYAIERAKGEKALRSSEQRYALAVRVQTMAFGTGIYKITRSIFPHAGKRYLDMRMTN